MSKGEQDQTPGTLRHVEEVGSSNWDGKGLEDSQQQYGASLVAQMVKNPPAVQETQVQSLGWEDRLEKEMATHSTCLENPMGKRNLAGYSPWNCKESDTVSLQQNYGML